MIRTTSFGFLLASYSTGEGPSFSELCFILAVDRYALDAEFCLGGQNVGSIGIGIVLLNCRLLH